MHHTRTPTQTPLRVNLPDRLEDFTHYRQEPFEIFEVENFVNDDFYADLTRDVNSRYEWDRIFRAKGNKRKFSVTGENFDDIEDSPLKTFAAYFLSHEFFDWFVRTHWPKYNKGTTPYYIYNRKSGEVGQLRRQHRQDGVAASYLYTELHYSSMEKGGFIPPHTDSPKKRLSFVFYIPSDPVPEHMQENLGTVFYRLRDGGTPWERFNSGLLDKTESREFLEHYDVAHTSRFQMNKCIGFVKSDVSWHAVSPNAFDYDRRAIVINMQEIGGGQR